MGEEREGSGGGIFGEGIEHPQDHIMLPSFGSTKGGQNHCLAVYSFLPTVAKGKASMILPDD